MNNLVKPKSLMDAISDKFAHVTKEQDMQKVSEGLHDVVINDGLGVAILVAWQHGLAIGHIPLTGNDPSSRNVDIIQGQGDCPYIFVHIPTRVFRSNVKELTERKIMNPRVDPAWLIYHEDGLIGTFSFPDRSPIKKDDISLALASLEGQGILVRANINNRQIQFKDLASKKRIEGLIQNSHEEVYVRVPTEISAEIDGDHIFLPDPLNSTENREWFYKIVRQKSPCNYCSVQMLNPHEATIHSATAHPSRACFSRQTTSGEPTFPKTVRNYQFGFTYAPFGDPQKVCHFLAWDFPHINDLVMNMDPQSFSFSDLIRLVTVINRDIRAFAKKHDVKEVFSIAGTCNHWGGNTIYHQHYQFFFIPEIPLLHALTEDTPLTTYRDVVVRKYKWAAPAYRIASAEGKQASNQDIMFVADRVAKEWQLLNEGTDASYGNGIEINSHTQNIFVSIIDGGVSAVFIPRHRGKLSTSKVENKIQKINAGALEMMGYFIIDEKPKFDVLDKDPPSARAELGNSWLSELAPKQTTWESFEQRLHDRLDTFVVEFEKGIKEALNLQDARAACSEMCAVWKEIKASKLVEDGQKLYLRNLINDEWCKKMGQTLIPAAPSTHSGESPARPPRGAEQKGRG